MKHIMLMFISFILLSGCVDQNVIKSNTEVSETLRNEMTTLLENQDYFESENNEVIVEESNSSEIVVTEEEELNQVVASEVTPVTDEIKYSEVSMELVTNNRVRIRTGPSITYDYLLVDYKDNVDQIDYLLTGTRVHVEAVTIVEQNVGDSRNYWFKVVVRDGLTTPVEGWVYGDFLTKYIQENELVYLEKLNNDLKKIEMNKMFETLEIQTTNELLYYWTSEEGDTSVVCFGNESPNLIGSPEKVKVYLIEHHEDKDVLSDTLYGIPHNIKGLGVVDIAGSHLKHFMMSVESVEGAEGFYLWSINNSNFSYIICALGSSQYALNQLVDSYRDGIIDHVVSTRRDNGGYSTQKTDYDIREFMAFYYTHKHERFVKEYITKAKAVLNEDFTFLDDIKNMIDKANYEVAPIIHPLLVSNELKTFDMKTYVYENGRGIINLYYENMWIGKFDIQPERPSTFSFNSIEWKNIDFDTLESVFLDYIETEEISLVDFEPAAFGSYYRYSLRKHAKAVELSLDFDDDGEIEELEIFPTQNYWFLRYEGNLTVINTDMYQYDVESICIADFDGDGYYNDLFVESDRNAPDVKYNFFDVIDNKLLKVDSLYTAIQYIDSQGNIYLWSDQLMGGAQTINEVVSTAKAYYNFIEGKHIINGSVIGSTQKWLFEQQRAVIKNPEDVPISYYEQLEWNAEVHEDVIVGYLNQFDAFIVLEVVPQKDLFKIELENGMTGWIGGFHSF